MIDDPDEPLEGDIGPAATGRPAGTRDADPASAHNASAAPADPAEELRRYEAEREERRRRVNAASGRVALALAAALLAFLVYDSAHTAVEAHSKGDDWVYPPAVVGGICALALVVLLVWAARRRSRRR
ncbi:hypothetical protein [Actinomadura fibrosa]|uniref:DUF1206 domain-containing protein n=1 Tax=Actinomadura fibrosa TaxID=111802 RepID=A0ABW2Y3C4_9ACTN|nr:hypothetical protein [Actinomadura fibrosa]